MKEFKINTFKELRVYIASDLYRYMTSTSLKAYVRGWYIAGFRYTFFMRCCKYFSGKGLKAMIPFVVCRMVLRHYSVIYGYQIPWQTNIGPGLYIGHYGTIIVNPHSTIGVNCNITDGVLLGLNGRTDEAGKLIRFEYPFVGNRVLLGNNAKIIGGVTIGNDAFIGVSSVITNDIPKNAVVVGIPGRIISYKGSSSLVGSFYPESKLYDEEENPVHSK